VRHSTRSNPLDIAEQMKEVHNIISFETEKAKRKEQPPPPGSEWLTKLELGTIFRVKQAKVSNVELIDYQLVWKGAKSVVVYCNKTNTKFPVDPVAFCNEAILFEILGVEKGIDE
jgi:hypothetical protein